MMTVSPAHEAWQDACAQMRDDVATGATIAQVFCYSESSRVGALEGYPQSVQELIDIAEHQQIPLYLCSAAFQKRSLTLTEIGAEDFTFKGLGQFINESLQADCVRKF